MCVLRVRKIHPRVQLFDIWDAIQEISDFITSNFFILYEKILCNITCKLIFETLELYEFNFNKKNLRLVRPKWKYDCDSLFRIHIFIKK